MRLFLLYSDIYFKQEILILEQKIGIISDKLIIFVQLFQPFENFTLNAAEVGVADCCDYYLFMIFLK